MNTQVGSSHDSPASLQRLGRIAGIFYLVNIVTSLVAFSGKAPRPWNLASGLTATFSYVVVTALLYLLFRSVSRSVSLIAALFSLAGCADGVLLARHLLPVRISPLVFFGGYCVLIGWLILRSALFPRVIGVLMMMAGMGWLTFVSQTLSNALSPYHYIMGGIGEGLLTLWLLVFGVHGDRRKQKGARASRRTLT